MSATKLTKTGQPQMGTEVEIELEGGTWERGKVVAVMYGRGGSCHMVGLGIEWLSDGERQVVHSPNWRSVAA